MHGVVTRPLADRVALVTGASSGLGRATAVALGAAGANLVLLARSASHIQATATEVRAGGSNALAVPVDLAREKDIRDAVGQTIATFGRVDVLVNAAGTDVPGAVVDVSVDAWDQVLDVNLRAPFILAKLVFPHMRRVGGGTIINVSSVAGKRGWANAGAYCASKFGLTGLTQALHAEGKPHGIRACVLFPGAMNTNWGIWSPSERTSGRNQPPPPGSDVLAAMDVAGLIVWIASAPSRIVINEAIVTPPEERGWP